MLKPAWYLTTEPDWWAAADASYPSPQAEQIAGDLAEQFGGEAELGPDRTVFAVEVMLHALQHLSDAIPYARVTLADTGHLARLLLGFNLAVAHLAQLTPQVADQIGTGAWVTGLTDPTRGELVRALTTAGCRFEEAASLFKEAHAVFLRSTSSRS